MTHYAPPNPVRSSELITLLGLNNLIQVTMTYVYFKYFKHFGNNSMTNSKVYLDDI